ncbi:MAG: hypothetical protein EBS83_15280 [Planctomycetia bacterium]|nr:hypothetical protein [Planctomycetia bacterium]
MGWHQPVAVATAAHPPAADRWPAAAAEPSFAAVAGGAAESSRQHPIGQRRLPDATHPPLKQTRKPSESPQDFPLAPAQVMIPFVRNKESAIHADGDDRRFPTSGPSD